jgi:hypothetical protein
MYAPTVDADGNELGGVPVVLLDAPLGHLPVLEHHGRWCTAFPPRPDLQLRGRHGAVRALGRRAQGHR